MLSGSKKKGFSLIELLVVIAIILILSVLAVGGYSQFRKATLLNLAADGFIAQIFEQKSETIYGEREGSGGFDEVKARLEGSGAGAGASGGDAGAGGAGSSGGAGYQSADPLCRGIYLRHQSDGSFDANTFRQTFVDKKVFNAVKGWVYQGCGNFTANDSVIAGSFQKFEMDQNIRIDKVIGGSAPVINDIIIRFVPPFGVMEVSTDGGSNFISDFSAASFKELKIVMQYGLGDQLKRTVVFNLINQNAVNE